MFDSTLELSVCLAHPQKSVEATLNDAEYIHGKVPQWNSEIVESCLKKLKEMSKQYKYVGQFAPF